MTKVLAFVALIGCAVAFASLFAPWLAVTAGPDLVCRASALGGLRGLSLLTQIHRREASPSP
jgi:hypothetical protein